MQQNSAQDISKFGLPPPVREALERGDLMTAIRLLRGSGLGLKEAKDALDAFMRGKSSAIVATPLQPRDPTQPQTHSQAGLGGLSPGQVPDTSESVWWAIVLALLAAAGYFLLRG